MQTLKPFFSFYGGKYRAYKYYPKPQLNTIVEPFAGSAGYSVRNFDKSIIINDADPKIYGLWNYLIKVQSSEILSLPLEFDSVDDCKVCDEAKWLMGFWINKCSAQPYKQKSSWMKSGTRPNSHWGECIRKRIAGQVECIRHWKVYNKSYEEIDYENVTYFIDPPYNNKAGRLYKYQVKDYAKLAEYCQSRKGQVIVCENEGANWLPFEKLATIKSNGSKYGKGYSKEVIYARSTQSA